LLLLLLPPPTFALTLEAELNRDRETTRLERRLAELEKRISDGKGGARDPQDLDAISAQQRQAFYRCE
jgi:hypothetical protein